MKLVFLSFVLTVGAYFYSIINHQLPDMAPWKVEQVRNADGTPSKFDLMRSGIKLQIHASHSMGDGSTRDTIIEDSDGDNQVDRAYAIGGLEDDEKMYFSKSQGIGLKYFNVWQEEWEESVHEVEKLLKHSIRTFPAMAKIPQ